MIGRIRINSIELDGVSLLDNKYRFYLKGLFDHTKTHYDSELYSCGSFNGGNKIDPKQIALNGYVRSNQFHDHMKLNSLLSKNSKRKLSIYVVGYGKLTMDVIVSSVIIEDNNFKSCQLIAYDPYLYGEEITLNINLYRSGITFPFKFPVKFGENSNISNIINNEGTEITYPVIEIKGPCINPSISNITTKEGLVFNGIELFENDTLVIDNRPRTRSIKINGTNRIDLKNGNWISCETGLNEFSFNAASSYDESLCKITIQSRWL